MLKSCARSTVAAIVLSQVLACQSLQAPEPATATAAEGANQAAVDNPAQNQYERALRSLQNDKTDEAISHFEQVIALNPSFALAHTNLGLLHLQKGDLEQAKKSFENAINQDKSDAIAYTHLAVIQRQQGAFEEARQNYERAIDSDADYANAYLNYGILLDIYLQDFPQALRQYEIYQKLADKPDETVDKWIIDLKRRLKAE